MTLDEMYTNLGELVSPAVVDKVRSNIDAYNARKSGDGSTNMRENPRIVNVQNWAVRNADGHQEFSVTFGLMESEFVEGPRTLHYVFDL
jgi:hypothetical protein